MLWLHKDGYIGLDLLTSKATSKYGGGDSGGGGGVFVEVVEEEEKGQVS